MRRSSELNSEDLRISTYLPQFTSDLVRELGIFSGSAPLRQEIFTAFIAEYRAHNNYDVQKLVIEIRGTATLSKKGRDRTSEHFRIISRSFLHRFT
jgi:hypothetical protein